MVRVGERLLAFVVMRHILSSAQIEVERVDMIFHDEALELSL